MRGPGALIEGPCAVQFAIYPLELVRTRLAVCPMGTYRGIWDCWGQIVRKEGWSCFYRGLTPSLVSTTTISLLALASFPCPPGLPDSMPSAGEHAIMWHACGAQIRFSLMWGAPLLACVIVVVSHRTVRRRQRPDVRRSGSCRMPGWTS